MLFFYCNTVVAFTFLLQTIEGQCYTSTKYQTHNYVPLNCSPGVLSTIEDYCIENDKIQWKKGVTNGVLTSQSNGNIIDYDFIICKERFSSCGYVPLSVGVPIGQSGVTIGAGVDLGQQSTSSLQNAGITSSLISIFSPYLGLKTTVAAEYVCENNLEITLQQAYNVTILMKKLYVNEVKTQYENNRKSNTKSFEELTIGVRTAMVSVYYRFGLNGAPSFSSYLYENNFEKAIYELRHFYSDETKSKQDRRLQQEANVMEASIGCESAVDCVFLLDESGSVGETNFLKALTFINNIIEMYNNTNNARFGFSLFASSYRTAFYLNTYNTITNYTSAVKAVSYYGGNTHLGEALITISSNQFNMQSGMRNLSYGVPRVLIVLTDGSSNGDVQVSTGTTYLSPKSVQIIAVGIANYDITQLQQLTSNIYTIDTFNDFNLIVNSISTQTCYIPTLLNINDQLNNLQLSEDEVDYHSLTLTNNNTNGNNIELTVDNYVGCVNVYLSYCTDYPSSFVYDVKYDSCSQTDKKMILSAEGTDCTVSSVRRLQYNNSTITLNIAVEGIDSTSYYNMNITTCDPKECIIGTNQQAESDAHYYAFNVISFFLLNIIHIVYMY